MTPQKYKRFEATMDFQNVNPLNVRLNMISGNLLPMISDNTSFPIFWRLYSVLMWLLQIVMMIGVIAGCFYVSKEKVLKDGMSCIAVVAEMLFILTRLHACRDVLDQLIRRINDSLSAADDTMRNVVMSTLQPVQLPLSLYCVAGTITVFMYNFASFMLLFQKDVFWYQDYAYPVAFFSQPMSGRTFFLGSFILLVGTIYMFLKKAGVDIYMVHIVLLVTAQYRYTALKLTMLFQNQEKNILYESRRMNYSEWEETELKALCRHHNALIHTTLLLKKTLSLICSMIYMSCVLRFCFLGIMLSIVVTSSFWGALIIAMYSSGAIMQLYILCFCVQQLTDASTQVTDEAFHQKWYLSGSSTKNIFMLIIIANNLECKLATFENFNLTLPSFMMILNQAYSVALLFLRMK